MDPTACLLHYIHHGNMQVAIAWSMMLLLSLHIGVLPFQNERHASGVLQCMQTLHDDIALLCKAVAHYLQETVLFCNVSSVASTA